MDGNKMSAPIETVYLKPVLEGIPETLKEKSHFVLWRSETREGKATKVPYQANGRHAKSNDPATWTSFPEASKALNNGGNFDGIGFVLSPQDNFTGIDLDKCRDPQTGAIEPWAQNIIKGINSYTEVSPSGTGIRIFVKDAQLPEHGRKRGKIEIYESGRYLTLTGHRVEGTPETIEGRQDQVIRFHKAVFDQKPKEAQEKPVPPAVLNRSDEALLARIYQAKNGEKIRSLFNGTFSGYPSQSEADLALCMHFAFWTDKDGATMDRLFRQSGLFREKWDKKHYSGGKTYGEETIRRACESTSETYRGRLQDQGTGPMEGRQDEPAGVETEQETPGELHKTGENSQEKQKVYSLKSAILPAEAFLCIPVEPRRCFLHPWLKEKSLVEIVAPRGIGKTWDALSIAIAACSGNGFGPWGGCDPVRGLYLDAEMAIQDVIDRLKMLQFPAGVPLFILSNDFAHTLDVPPAHLGDVEWRKKFKKFLIEEKIELVILDNIASLTPNLDENSKQEWDPIGQYLLDLRRSGISVIFIHHAGKSGTSRGTSGREDNLDIVIELKYPQGYVPEDGCRFIKHFTKHRLPQNELALIRDMEFKLIPEKDHYTWAWNDVKKEIKKECLRLLKDGIDQKTICAILEKSKGYVSKMKAEFIQKGFLSAEGELLPRGILFLGSKQETFEETEG